MIRHEDINDGPLSSKLHKVWCWQCTVPCNPLFHPCRQAVSGKKKRFMEEGFDLDLAYITPNIIVHGFPAHGLEHIYRNPRYEVRRFMDKYHENNYKVYNFCCEYGRGYDPDTFYGRVERYPFKDHNTPPLQTMVDFANSAKEWLDETKDHVVNMHCKAGKGRAGLMCCVLLVRTGVAQSAIEAMDLYDRERVTNRRGLTVTSQRKFVIFYEALWRRCWGVTGNIGDISAEEARKFKIPEQPTYRISAIELLHVPDGLVYSYRIVTSKISNFGPDKLHDSGWKKLQPGEAIAVEADALLQANFKVFVYFKSSFLASAMRLVELQHNTFFMLRNQDYCDFPVDQLDIKKKVKPKLGENVVLRLHFAPLNQPDALPAPRDSLSSPPSKGYALVSKEEEGGLELKNVTLGASGGYDRVHTEEVTAASPAEPRADPSRA
eukprot:gene6044-6657_t